MQKINPQPLSLLKSRFRDAVKDVYDVDKVRSLKQARPGEQHQHVFDFEDGIRIIVSRDKLKNKEVLHFSASVFEGYTYDRRLSFSQYVTIFFDQCTTHISELSGCKKSDLQLIGLTAEKGIPHWIIELAYLN